jgi:ATP-binding cassette subfamily G (WHITE) protein 2 (PDR)
MADAGPFTLLPEAQEIAAAIELQVKQSHEKTDQGHTEETNTLNGTDKDSDSSSTERETEMRVAALVRTFTHASVRDEHGDHVNPFYGSTDPALDPTSGKFNARAWTKTLVGITSRDPEKYPQRTAGVAYKNLNVHGFGNPTDYQKTFGNYPLEIVGLFNKISGRGKRKIQILRDFDGLVKAGEMLVVLGRPGR